MAEPNSSGNVGKEEPTLVVRTSYSAGRSFLKDGEEPCLHISWDDFAINSFVEKGNQVRDWLIDWPMTSKSLMQNIVDILKENGGGKSLKTVAIGPNTPAQFERIFKMLEKMEKDPFMQQVMKAVRAKHGFDKLAEFSMSHLDDQGLVRPDSIGLCVLPRGYIHLFK